MAADVACVSWMVWGIHGLNIYQVLFLLGLWIEFVWKVLAAPVGSSSGLWCKQLQNSPGHNPSVNVPWKVPSDQLIMSVAYEPSFPSTHAIILITFWYWWILTRKTGIWSMHILLSPSLLISLLLKHVPPTAVPHVLRFQTRVLEYLSQVIKRVKKRFSEISTSSYYWVQKSKTGVIFPSFFWK